MSDRLTLADAIETAGIVRKKAVRIASVIFGGFARQDVAIERLRSALREMERRITLRLGGIYGDDRA